MRAFFSGLRGKLTLTYTLVTVLALMALEVLLLLLIWSVVRMGNSDQRDYLDDVVSTLYPQAREYLQPGKKNLSGLQTWLDDVAKSGYASLPPQDTFDSPAAAIVPGTQMLVVDTDLTILAQSPLEPNNLVGRRYSAGNASLQNILDNALEGSHSSLALSYTATGGKIRMAVPILQSDWSSAVVGVLLLTLEPAPSTILSTLPIYIGWVLGTGMLMLLAVAPFGTLFGFIMSRGLTRRLTALSRAADAWSEGDFQLPPVDRSKDEIGVLGMKLRNMAERIQTLLHTQQELAILEERNRLARDLHDTVKQESFATFMQIRAARNLLRSDPDAAEKHLVEAEGLIKASQQELSLLIAELHPAALEGQGLTGALYAFINTWQEHSRIPVTFQIIGERRLPLALEQAFFRVAQEALSNVARHSRASSVSVQLEYQPDRTRLTITDNGVGFDPQQVTGQGFGLESMKARLEDLGGRLEIRSARDQGAQVTAWIPLDQDKGQPKHAN